MASAFIEHRPKSNDPSTSTSHYVIVINGEEHGRYTTQQSAKEAACKGGYIVHVARVRHLQDRDQPAHWRRDPC